MKRDESNSPKRCSKWICQCDCGNIKSVYRDKLLNGNTVSCGCARKYVNMKDLTGQKFGRLTAVERTDKKSGHSYIYKCRCDCGNVCFVSGYSLSKMITQSCGCLASEVHKKSYKKGMDARSSYYVDQTDVLNILPKKPRKNNTSGYTGVVFNKQSGTWRAYIYFKGNKYYLGSYSNKEDAAAARKVAESKIFGNFLEWFSEEFPDRWRNILSKSHRKPNAENEDEQ